MKWVPKTCHIVYVKIYKVLKKYTHDRKKMTTNEMKKKIKTETRRRRRKSDYGKIYRSLPNLLILWHWNLLLVSLIILPFFFEREIRIYFVVKKLEKILFLNIVTHDKSDDE